MVLLLLLLLIKNDETKVIDYSEERGGNLVNKNIQTMQQTTSLSAMSSMTLIWSLIYFS
jgi:hypothetical protein